MSRYRVRPLTDKTWLRPPGRRTTSGFDSTWTQTLDLLEREVAHLDGKDLVIGVDVDEADLRLDGTLRARAQAATPAVEVAFDSRHGPMLYRADGLVSRYYDQGPDWQQNVRAIAKTLEALRAVDRYGASASGEQYRGYRQIGSAPVEPSALVRSTVELRARLAEIAGVQDTLPTLDLLRRARRHAHPDRGGNEPLWHEVQGIGVALGVSGATAGPLL